MNLAAAAVAGLLLAASDHPLHLWWLQFVAFVPFWWGLWRQRAANRSAWAFGLTFGGTNAAATVLAAGLAPPIVVAAIASTVQWMVATGLAKRCIGRGPVRGSLAAAAMLTLVELVTQQLVPVFGTAQAFVRPLSAAPMLVAFVAFTGVGGLVFVVAALQALLVAALRGPSRWLPVATAVALLATVAMLDVQRWTRPLGETARVAVFGWGTDRPKSDDGTSFVQIAASMAAGSQCQLLVTPEVGMTVTDRDHMLTFFRELAALHPLPIAIGVWHEPTQDNRIWFVDQDGALTAEYRKSHLVPFFESYATGDGAPVTVPFAGTQLGGMICQDDNFTDVARAYGRAGVPLVAVPTNDWPAIREFHLENAVFRAIENGYAVARATSGGISALVSPRGELLTGFDHIGDVPFGTASLSMSRSLRLPSATMVHADLPLGDRAPTIYARFGDLPILLLCAALVLISLRRRDAPA